MKPLYPLKFQTIYKDKIWGGNKISTILQKDFSPLPNCGETWEISGVKGDISVAANGELSGKNLVELIDEYKGSLVGNRVYQKYGNEFPLLVKFIDANDDLSIQVHPDDALAKKRHNSFGKTEMWYIIQADPGSHLITGFNQKVNKEIYLQLLEQKKLNQILNSEPVESDDVFFIPAGRVHTIGKGLLLAEIQQTSDVTYRIYDFDRVDDKGQGRELHTEQALDAIDYNLYDQYKTNYTPRQNEVTDLVKCQYFQTNRLHYTEVVRRDYSAIDSFIIYVCLDGSAIIKGDFSDVSMKKGDSLLIPAALKNIELLPQGEFKILESYVP